jgi:N,N'-diacetylchitobiose phosphorylase
MVVDPCVPGAWKHFEIRRQWRGATYNIKVENPDGVQKGVKEVTLNGKTTAMPIAAQEAGSVNDVVVTMG